MPDRPSKLWRLWHKTAAAKPQRPVLFDPESDRVWTANELTEAAVCLSENFGAHLAGQKIAFSLPNSVEWIRLFLALQKKGIAAMPLDSGLSPEAARAAARQLGAAFFWTGTSLEQIRKSRPSPGVCCCKITSGTTGQPKALPCRDAHLIADGRNIIATMGIRSADRNLGAIPFAHSYAMGNLLLPLILQGTAIIPIRVPLPGFILTAAKKFGATVLPGVPPVFQALTTVPQTPDLPKLRLVISAGARITPEIARAFFEKFGRKIHNFYGSSETGGIAYDRTGSATLSGTSLGKPLEKVSISIRKDRRVVVSSQAVLLPRGRAVLADLGEWNSKHELVLLGRAGTLANIGGKKAHPFEVEQALRKISGVGEVWIEILQDARRGDYFFAAVETTLSLMEIETALFRSLPDWKIPRRYWITEKLPRTERGKLDATAIRAKSLL